MKVGVMLPAVGARNAVLLPGWRPVGMDPAAVPDAFGRWAAEGVDHLRLVGVPATDGAWQHAPRGHRAALTIGAVIPIM